MAAFLEGSVSFWDLQAPTWVANRSCHIPALRSMICCDQNLTAFYPLGDTGADPVWYPEQVWNLGCCYTSGTCCQPGTEKKDLPGRVRLLNESGGIERRRLAYRLPSPEDNPHPDISRSANRQPGSHPTTRWWHAYAPISLLLRGLLVLWG